MNSFKELAILDLKENFCYVELVGTLKGGEQ